MIKDVVVEVQQREERGTNACRRLRAAGLVPAIVYGLDRPTYAIAVSPRRISEVLKLESGRNTIFSLALAGQQSEKRPVMIRELQRDPVTENMVHLDFVRVDLERTLTVNVPVQLVGTPVGVKNEGGVIDFVHREVEVECLPEDIPEHLVVDVSELGIHQHVSVSDLQGIERVKILEDADTVVAVVNPPRVEAEPEPEEAEVAEGVEAAAEGAEEAPAKEGEAGAEEAKPKGQ